MNLPRNRKLLTGLGLAGTVILLLLLFYPWDNRYYPRSLKAAWDLGHVVLFAILVFAAFRYRPGLLKLSFARRLAAVTGAALLAGGLIETIQYYLGRDASYYDLSLDVLGALIAVSWYPVQPVPRSLYSAGLRWLCLLAVGASLFPATAYLYDEYSARKEFPLLADFDSPLETSRFGDNDRLEWTGDSLRVYFTTEHYSGFTLRYFPRDWQEQRELVLELYNPGRDFLTLTCRIHDMSHNDAYGDRYNRVIRVLPGNRVYRMDLADVKSAPATRSMNMDRIAALGCFTTDLAVPAVLYIESIYLR